jgi:GNAT superfamily N-acetyltransferase
VLHLVTDLDDARRAEVEAGLRAFNAVASPVLRAYDERGETEMPLDVYALDGDELVGGVVGATWATWLELDFLWVRDDQRGTGLGHRLLAEVEHIAREERGCVAARLCTWDFQAGPFYEAHGYQMFGVLEDYPPGVTEYYLVKRFDR